MVLETASLLPEEMNAIEYWLTGCEDMQTRESKSHCEDECPIYSICKNLREKIFGKDVLKDKEYTMDCNLREPKIRVNSPFYENIKNDP